MTFWNNHLLNTETECLDILPIDLPEYLDFTMLNVSHLSEIYYLINHHYQEDNDHLTRTVYSKDYLYWYLRNAKIILGLTCNKKLIGLVTATIITIKINDRTFELPKIDLLCLQKKVRKCGLMSMLINELNNQIILDGYYNAVFCTSIKNSKLFCSQERYIVPLNYEKLCEIGFLEEGLDPLPKIQNNPFHLMKESDIPTVTLNLNQSLSKFPVKQIFDEKAVHHYFLPKKNIVYSFVIRSEDDITDFVSVQKNYMYCLEKEKMISTAYLTYSFHSMDITDLFYFLMDKLITYRFDQLIFNQNYQPDITKFKLDTNANYYLYNLHSDEISPDDMGLNL